MQEDGTKSTSEKYQKCNYHYWHENNRCGSKRFANTECPGVSNFITLTTFRFENFFGGPSTSFSYSDFTDQPIKSQFELCTRRRIRRILYQIHTFPLAQHIDAEILGHNLQIEKLP